MTTTTPRAEVAPDVDERPTTPPATGGRSADHKTVGTLFIVVALLFLVATGVLALIMRAQLTTADTDFLERSTYREIFTFHGVLGVFLFLAPAWIGLATAMVPLQIGATRLAFPRLQAFCLWLLVAGGALIVASPFASGPDITSGWALNTPFPEGKAFRGDTIDLLVVGLITVGLALLIAAVNLIVTIVKFRAPGLTQRRSPLFTWSVFVSGAVFLLALPVLIGALGMLFADRHYGGRIFNGFTGSRGGNAAMWPRLFWFAAYPILWALLLPALGAISEIVAVFSRRRLFDHGRALAALAAVGVLAFAGWGGELTGLGKIRYVFAAGGLLVLLPVASLALNWLATLGTALRGPRRDRGTPRGARPDLRAVPMLGALGALSVLGVGLAGAAVLAVRAGMGTHRTYWAVATQHTLYFGTATIAFVAAIHYWAPKLWGRHLSAAIGRVETVLLVVGAQLTFLPFFVLGLQHMHIHLASYTDADWEPANVVSSAGAAILGLAVVVLVADIVVSIGLRRGRPGATNPWDGHTLEWATASPPPLHNFDSIPEIRSETPVLDLGAAGLPPGRQDDDALTEPGAAPTTAGVSG